MIFDYKDPIYQNAAQECKYVLQQLCHYGMQVVAFTWLSSCLCFATETIIPSTISEVLVYI